jgi:hypothetical protein
VFAHGANWLPCDMRISECTDEDYEYLISSAAEANMNFLRVWGGGGVEKEAFYAACDRHGVMVYVEAPPPFLALFPFVLSCSTLVKYVPRASLAVNVARPPFVNSFWLCLSLFCSALLALWS